MLGLQNIKSGQGKRSNRSAALVSACGLILVLVVALLPIMLTGCNSTRADDEDTSGIKSSDLDNAPTHVVDYRSSETPMENASPATMVNSSTDKGQLLNVDIAPVKRLNLTSRLDLVGTLVPLRETTIVSEVDGVIQSFPFAPRKLVLNDPNGTVEVPLDLDIGHPVKAGMPVVRLRDEPQKLSLQVAEANRLLVEKKLKDLYAWKRKEEVAQLEAALSEAKARAANAAVNLDRSSQLIVDNSISKSDYDRAVMTKATADAAVAAAQATLDMAKSGPTKEQIEVAQAQLAVAEAQVAIAKDNLSKTVVLAPYDGVVTDRYVDVGDRVTAMPRVEILKICDPRILYAEIAVPEQYQQSVHIGDTVEILVKGFARKMIGRIDMIGEMIDTETRTFMVRATIDNRNGMLKPGGFVSAKLEIASAQQPLTVPYKAVVFEEGRPTVFVYRDGRVSKRQVRIGIPSHDRYEILEGVDEGEIVVASETALLSDGQKVAVKK